MTFALTLSLYGYLLAALCAAAYGWQSGLDLRNSDDALAELEARREQHRKAIERYEARGGLEFMPIPRGYREVDVCAEGYRLSDEFDFHTGRTFRKVEAPSAVPPNSPDEILAYAARTMSA